MERSVWLELPVGGGWVSHLGGLDRLDRYNHRLDGCLCSLAAGNVSSAVNIAAAIVRARDIIGISSLLIFLFPPIGRRL
jgi:hypothetical protein